MTIVGVKDEEHFEGIMDYLREYCCYTTSGNNDTTVPTTEATTTTTPSELYQKMIKAAEDCEFGQNTTETVENKDEALPGYLGASQRFCDYILIKI